MKVMQEEQLPQIISDELSPQERYISGKRFRLKRQYFFVSASVQWAVKQHMKKYNTIYSFHEKTYFS